MTALSQYPTSLSGPHHHILPKPGSRQLVIFFGAKDLKPEHFNFFQLGRELEAHRIFVNNGANHWYQYGIPGLGESYDETLQNLRNWADYLETEEICTIGTSMGGYGAIQYGAALGARVLAFSTDARLSVPGSQSARHFTGTEPPSCPDLVEHLARHRADVTLLAGERDPGDLLAAWHLQQAPGVQVRSVIGVGHILPTALSRQARLGPLLRGFLDHAPIPDHTIWGGALAAGDYAQSCHEAERARIDQDWEKARELAQQALCTYPGGEAAELILARIEMQLRRWDEALNTLGRLIAKSPNDPELATEFARALRELGAYDQARFILGQILERLPDYHRAHYALSLIANLQSDTEAAEYHVSEALRIQPKITAYRKRYDRLTSRSEAAAEASNDPMP